MAAFYDSISDFNKGLLQENKRGRGQILRERDLQIGRQSNQKEFSNLK